MLKGMIKLRKFTAVILIIMIACAAAACSSKVEDNNSASLNDNRALNNEALTVAKNTVSAENIYSIYSGGKNYAVVELKFGNKDTEPKSFYDAYDIKAYQNGVEIYQNNSWQCDQFDLKACAAKVQPRYDTKIYMAFEPRDLQSSVDLECTPLGGGEAKKTTLSINSQYYVSQQQIDAKKAEEEKAKQDAERAAKEAADKAASAAANQVGIAAMKATVSAVGCSYCVYDFDKDGNSDIVFKVDHPTGNDTYYTDYAIYIYENGNFVNAGTVSTGYQYGFGLYKSKKNGCYNRYYAIGSTEVFAKYEYHNGVVDRNDNDNLRSADDIMKSNPNRIVDNKIVSEEVYNNNRKIILANEMSFTSPNDTSQIANASFSG